MRRRCFSSLCSAMVVLSLLLPTNEVRASLSRTSALPVRHSRSGSSGGKDYSSYPGVRQVIRYQKGKKPFLLLIPAAALPYSSLAKSGFNGDGRGHFSLATPGGLVSVFWRTDAVLETGDVIQHPSKKRHNPKVMQIAIVSPPLLPIVLEVEEPKHGWLHVDGHVTSFFANQSRTMGPRIKRISWGGGRLTLLQAGVNYAD